MQQLGSNLARGPCLLHSKIILPVNCSYRIARVIIIRAVNTRHFDFDVTKYSDKCIETTMIALSKCSKCTKTRLRDLNVSTLSEWSRANACPSKYNMPTVFLSTSHLIVLNFVRPSLTTTTQTKFIPNNKHNFIWSQIGFKLMIQLIQLTLLATLGLYFDCTRALSN